MKLKGNKTYIVGIATLMYLIGGVVAGKLDFAASVPLALIALEGMGLRHGMGDNSILVKMFLVVKLIRVSGTLNEFRSGFDQNDRTILPVFSPKVIFYVQ